MHIRLRVELGAPGSRQGPAQGRGNPPHREGASADPRPACAGAAATSPTAAGAYMLLWTVQVFVQTHTLFGKPHWPAPPSILHVSVSQLFIYVHVSWPLQTLVTQMLVLRHESEV